MSEHYTKHDWSAIEEFISQYWKENKSAPSYSQMMEFSGIKSRGALSHILHHLPGIRITAGGHPVPDWVDQAIEREKE